MHSHSNVLFFGRIHACLARDTLTSALIETFLVRILLFQLTHLVFKKKPDKLDEASLALPILFFSSSHIERASAH